MLFDFIYYDVWHLECVVLVRARLFIHVVFVLSNRKKCIRNYGARFARRPSAYYLFFFLWIGLLCRFMKYFHWKISLWWGRSDRCTHAASRWNGIQHEIKRTMLSFLRSELYLLAGKPIRLKITDRASSERSVVAHPVWFMRFDPILFLHCPCKSPITRL